MPFTTSQFLDVFRQYNQAVWPAQWLLNALAVLTVLLAVISTARASRVVTLILAVLWMWMGVVYHLIFFTRINQAAIAFGILFVIEGLMLLRIGFVEQRLHFRPRWNVSSAVAGLLVLYALVLYPVIGYMIGRRYPAVPTFGLPCPTTIFTLGLLLWVDGRTPVRLLVIPAIWALLGFSAGRSMGMTEDYGLLIGGVVTSALILRRDWRFVLHRLPSGNVR